MQYIMKNIVDMVKTINLIQQLLIKHSMQLQHLSSLYNIHQLLLLVQQSLIKFL